MATMRMWRKIGRHDSAPDDPDMLDLWREHGPALRGMSIPKMRAELGFSVRQASALRRFVTEFGLDAPTPDWPLGYAEPGNAHPDPDAARAAIAARLGIAPPPSESDDALPESEHAGLVKITTEREPDYHHDAHSDTYVLQVNGRTGGTHRVEMAGEIVRDMRRDYSSQVGKGLTQAELARKYQIQKAWIPQILRKLGITHSDDPFTDEEYANPAVSDALLRHEAVHIRRAKIGNLIQRDEQRALERDAKRWRRLEAGVQEMMPTLERMRAGDPPLPRLPMTAPIEPYAAVIGLSDWHYNMLSGDESRTPYNRAEAVRALRAGRDRLIAELHLRGRPDTIIAHIAGDNLHTEGHVRETSKGTPQVCEVAPHIGNAEGMRLHWEEFLLPLARVAPVEAYVTPGNHGEGAEAAMGQALQMLAEATDYPITVRWAHRRRIYAEYGRCGIQMDHGHRQKPRDLVELFATDEPELWGRATYRVSYQGHLHHDWVKRYRGCTWRLWNSLSGSCGWAEAAGHTGAVRSIDAELLSPEGRSIGFIYGGC